MLKLKALVPSSLDGSSSRLTNYTKFIQEVAEDDDENNIYQNVKLKEFYRSKFALEGLLDEIITRICHSVKEGFGDLNVSPIYNHLYQFLT